MAVRLNLDKLEQVKQSYIDYLNTGKYTSVMLQLFAKYKVYLDADEVIRNFKQSIKSQKEAAIRKREEIRKEQDVKVIQPTKKKKSKKNVTTTTKKASKVEEPYVPFSKRFRSKYDNNKQMEERRQIILERMSGYNLTSLSESTIKIKHIHTISVFERTVTISFLKSIKDVEELRLLRSLINRLFIGQSSKKEEWLQRIKTRICHLNTKAHYGNKVRKYEPVRATIISTPMGGLNKRY